MSVHLTFTHYYMHIFTRDKLIFHCLYVLLCSSTHSLAQHLAQILQPIAEEMLPFINNSIHLIDILKTFTINAQITLISFNIILFIMNIVLTEMTKIRKDNLKICQTHITLHDINTFQTPRPLLHTNKMHPINYYYSYLPNNS